MVHHSVVDQQLKKIGADFRYWGRGEARELPAILLEGEVIQMAIMGRYNAGFAMLVTTDQRILLVDKKPLYLAVEDVRYDMVAEVDYRHQLIDATVTICTINKQLRFTSSRKNQLRNLTSFIQQRVSDLRQHQQFQQQPGPLQTAPTVMASAPATYGLNPYNKVPLMMRRRISPFSVAIPYKPIDVSGPGTNL